jgi:hypothetical protein
MKVSPQETRFMRRLEGARASVEAVTVLWVGEQAFLLALEFLGSIDRVRYCDLVFSQYQNLYMEKRAVLSLKYSDSE